MKLLRFFKKQPSSIEDLVTKEQKAIDAEKTHELRKFEKQLRQALPYAIFNFQIIYGRTNIFYGVTPHAVFHFGQHTYTISREDDVWNFDEVLSQSGEIFETGNHDCYLPSRFRRDSMERKLAEFIKAVEDQDK